jgi:hypothetical protein
MSIQFFAVKEALRELDKISQHKTPKYNRQDTQKVDVVAKLANFQSLLVTAKDGWFISESKYKELEGKVFALSYRLGKLRGGADKLPEPDQSIVNQLKIPALAWKQKQVVFGDKPVLTDADIEKLSELSCYSLVYPHVDLDRFFKWTLMNNQSVDLFVQFPSIVKRINQCLLSARVGTFGGLDFVDNEGEKDVTLRMESNPVSILNEKDPVMFNKGLQCKVEDVFKSFKNKNYEEGIFTYFKDEGVVPFDSFAMAEADASGQATPIDVTDKENWYKSLRMREHLTKEEASLRFGTPCDGTKFILSIVCASQIKELDTYGSHSFLRMAIPDGNGGYDYTYGMGKFSKEYPKGALDGATFFFMPKKGAIQYVDNNEIYTNRRKLETHYSLDSDKGKACLESFRQDIEDAQAGNLVFQILRWNCSDWGVKKIRKFVGKEESKLMDISYLELSPKGLLGSILKILRGMAGWFQRFSLNVIAFIGGGWHGMTVTKADGTEKTYRILSTPPWGEDRANKFHHPGKVFQ